MQHRSHAGDFIHLGGTGFAVVDTFIERVIKVYLQRQRRDKRYPCKFVAP